MTDRSRVWAEVLALYLGTCLVIRGIKLLIDNEILGGDWLVLVALVFLYSPVIAEKTTGYRLPSAVVFPDPFWPAMRRALLFFAVVAGLIYVVFIPGYHLCQTRLYHALTHSQLWSSLDNLLAIDLGTYGRFRPHRAITAGIWMTIALQAIWQLLCVGYAEEFFYRGYMQTRLNQVFSPDRFSFLGARFGWSLPVTALLFTVGHSLVTWQWWQPFILFPALVFGWMRSRSGNVLAGALFHAWANTAMMVMDHIYGIGKPLEETGLSDLWSDIAGVGRWIAGLFG